MAELSEHLRLMDHANRRNPELATQLVDDIEYGGQQVHMLMAVQVAGGKSGAQHPPALLGELPPYVAKVDTACEVAKHEPVGVGQKPALRPDQGWDLVAGKERLLLDQREMNTDIECRGPPGQPSRMIERPADGHDGGRGENASAMRLEDAFVDPRGQAEVVRVDDQSRRDTAAEGAS